MKKLETSDWLKWATRTLRYRWYYDMKADILLYFLRKKRKFINLVK